MRLFHYSSLESLFGIIRENCLCFWATRYSHLNDPTEYEFGKKLLVKNRALIESNFCQICDFDDPFPMIPYIISFCKEDDDFTMWRLYGNDGKGVMLELEISDEDINNDVYTKDGKTYLKMPFEIIDSVEYTTEEKFIYHFSNLFSKNFGSFDMSSSDLSIDYILEIIPFIKDKRYEVENEARIVLINPGQEIWSFNEEKEDVETIERISENVEIVKFRERDGIPIPYIEEYLPSTVLKSITLGYALKNREVERMKIMKHLIQSNYNSEIPIKYSKH